MNDGKSRDDVGGTHHRLEQQQQISLQSKSNCTKLRIAKSSFRAIADPFPFPTTIPEYQPRATFLAENQVLKPGIHEGKEIAPPIKQVFKHPELENYVTVGFVTTAWAQQPVNHVLPVYNPSCPENSFSLFGNMISPLITHFVNTPLTDTSQSCLAVHDLVYYQANEGEETEHISRLFKELLVFPTPRALLEEITPSQNRLALDLDPEHSRDYISKNCLENPKVMSLDESSHVLN
ncbi:uncharacterized protein BDR25DRAFT_360942 [Lindgomyces ingoldianus]|uniref:Uncharacterized protein n=1 Tax=Lindgomyces ingoldianus TaxID=673940 RepID=A0ACB6QFW1_9PLEO|nr:uncharacterized protein BDR25DRAFT_360942 [Lindgomyces ingoldianus]KAF2465035.1 hypothetical protein BDR25DRAFT_360942 [Lindgomyces ingoldianus]